MRLLTYGFLLLSCLSLSGMAVAGDYSRTIPEGARVLVMIPDVEVGLKTAAGLVEPNQEWTLKARTALEAALASVAQEKGLSATVIKPETLNPELQALRVDLERLHGAVAKSILGHRFAGVTLPSKKSPLDWTFGPTVAQLAGPHQADYLMFFVARDSFSSAGAVVLNILFTGIGGAPVMGGRREAYGMLVDAKTGDVAWFDMAQSQFGDVRSDGGARHAVKDLLKTVKLAVEPVVKASPEPVKSRR